MLFDAAAVLIFIAWALALYPIYCLHRIRLNTWESSKRLQELTDLMETRIYQQEKERARS